MNAASSSPSPAPLVRANENTAFILGNGPSLAAIDLHRLSAFATVGLNAAYRHWRQIDWRPRYYACLDTVVGLSHKDEIAALIAEGRIRKFILRGNLVEAMGPAGRNPNVVIYEEARLKTPLLNIDPTTTGSHAALWAASLGYDQVVLLGVDVNYREIVDGAERRNGIELEIVRESANPNYYFDGYQAPGDRFNLPNPRPDLHLNAWRRAGQKLKAAGVQIYNGNPASGVACFPFIEPEAFLMRGAAPAPPREDIDAIHFDAPPRPLTQMERLRAFYRTYKTKGVLALAALALVAAAWIVAAKPAPLLLAGALMFLLAGVAAATAGLYARFAVLTHLRRMEEELAGLKTRLAMIRDNRLPQK